MEDTLSYVLSKILVVFVHAMLALMLARAVLSFIPLNDDDEESFFSRAVFLITEPLIVPVRSILGLFFDVEGFPVDVSFYVTTVLLGLLASVPLAV